MDLQLGLQLFTVYDTLREDFEGGLAKYREMGYQNMELASFDPGELAGKPPLPWKSMSGKELGELGRRLDVNFISISVPLPMDVEQLKNTPHDWARTAEYHKEAGSLGPIYSMMFFRNKEEVLYFADYLNQAGKTTMQAAGVPVFYHNHYQEFQQFDGKAAMDIILEETDPGCVKMELDTFWAQRGGVDPIAYLEKLGSRCPLIHQKDLSAAAQKVNLLEGVTHPLTMEDFMSAAKPEDFIEVGEGVMNISGIIAQARKGGSRYIVVEQDYSKLSGQDSAQKSYDNMVRLLGS